MDVSTIGFIIWAFIILIISPRNIHEAIKQNYLTAILLCFIAAIFCAKSN